LQIKFQRLHTSIQVELQVSTGKSKSNFKPHNNSVIIKHAGTQACITEMLHGKLKQLIRKSLLIYQKLVDTSGCAYICCAELHYKWNYRLYCHHWSCALKWPTVSQLLKNLQYVTFHTLKMDVTY